MISYWRDHKAPAVMEFIALCLCEGDQHLQLRIKYKNGLRQHYITWDKEGKITT